MNSRQRTGVTAFRTKVWRYYREHGRHDLPWRKKRAAYAVLVSEIMLQQTQVERVTPKFKAFMGMFPNVRALAHAPLRDVLRVWSGLGYNRRAKMLHECAKTIVQKYNGRIPRDIPVLESLPGIGPYTARAIACFAYDEPTAMLETNIRAVVLHEFFTGKSDVHDSDINEILIQALVPRRAREWNWALMDYGAYLKQTHPNPSRNSAHHTKQSTFKGSNRELRGKIMKDLLIRAASSHTLAKKHHEPQERIEHVLAQFARDGFVKQQRGIWHCV